MGLLGAISKIIEEDCRRAAEIDLQGGPQNEEEREFMLKMEERKQPFSCTLPSTSTECHAVESASIRDKGVFQ